MIRRIAATLALILFSLPAHAFDTKATSAYIVDQTTGTVLLAKNADTPLPPASHAANHTGTDFQSGEGNAVALAACALS